MMHFAVYVGVVRFFHKLTLFCLCLSLLQCNSIGMLERFILMKKGLLQPIDAAHYTHVFNFLEKEFDVHSITKDKRASLLFKREVYFVV